VILEKEVFEVTQRQEADAGGEVGDGRRDPEHPEDTVHRWVVEVGEDNSMKLQLQSLPEPAVPITGKPTLRQ
jgi:hypothetical protein